MGKKKTQEQFINECKLKHGDKYDYGETVYNGRHKFITYKCNTCNSIITQQAGNHLQGNGCRYCNLSSDITTDEFIARVYKIHGNRFDLSEIIYTRSKDKVKVKCNICQYKFERITDDLLRSHIGCSNCSNIAPLTTIAFIEKAIKIHGTDYNYDLVEFVNTYTKVKIYCKTCNIIFEMRPNSHLNGQGCKHCHTKSKGELFIIRKFNELNIDYINDKTLHWSNLKRYDFILHDYKIILEIHGAQHYRETYFFTNTLKQIQENDKYKQFLAELNGYKYIVLNYIDSNFKMLNKEFKSKFLDIYM
jgi:hypothetical protein